MSPIENAFFSPPADPRSMLLWVWNSELTLERVHKTLDEFKAAGFGGVFVHPRPGLVTEYLGEEWFVLWREALEHCVKLSGEVVSLVTCQDAGLRGKSPTTRHC